jgi:predicted Zn-dependent protease
VIRRLALASLAAAALALPFAIGVAAAEDVPAAGPPAMAADSDEAGLWMMFEQAERNVRRSPLLVTDPALNAYVRAVVCKVAGSRCNEVRVYILDIPLFNASMAPNGMMHVWTGLLLRAQNEAELAFVLGHEFRHFSAKHSLAQFRSIRDTSNVLSFFTLIAAGVGAGFVGDLAQLAALGALFSYGRDQEREADLGGLETLKANGYDLKAGAAIWQALIIEQNANKDRRKPSLFTSTHPDPEERMKTMGEAADKLLAEGAPVGVTNADAFRAAMRPFRARWLEGELARGEYDESLVLIGRLVALEPNSGELRYFLGEAYRRRGGEGDLERAREAYQQAVAMPSAMPAAYRGLGLIDLKLGDKPGAKQAFTTYLAQAPNADDRAMIQFYLQSL